jgi:hypothetical protein
LLGSTSGVVRVTVAAFYENLILPQGGWPSCATVPVR